MSEILLKKELEPQGQIEMAGVFENESNFVFAQRIAKMLCTSSLVPDEYRGEKAIGNCLIALELANRLKISPLTVMQNLYIIKGRPSWSSQFLIGQLNGTGKFTPLRFEFSGTRDKDDWSCRAFAIDNAGEVLYGTWISIKMAKSEGWVGKVGSKWLTMPEQMLQYRAAAFFCRLYAPEITLGLLTYEEVVDMKVPVNNNNNVELQQKASNFLNNLELKVENNAIEKEVDEEFEVTEQISGLYDGK
jgi:hypothetical protein